MICRYCNAQIDNNAYICMHCGCPAKFTLTIKRENQFYLINPPIGLDIISNSLSFHVEVNNGQMLPLILPPDIYQINASSGFRKAHYTLDLNQDRILRLGWDRFSGKIELWELSRL